MVINPVLFGVLACIFAQLVLLFGWGFYHRVLKDELHKRIQRMARLPMTDGIKRRNVIREMQKRTIGEALYSKKIGRKPNASAKKIGVLPARQGQSRA